jgi:hypothetical protein
LLQHFSKAEKRERDKSHSIDCSVQLPAIIPTSLILVIGSRRMEVVMSAGSATGGIETTAATAEAGGSVDDADDHAFPYPTTLFLLWSLHALYYLQRAITTTPKTSQRRYRNGVGNGRRKPPPLISYDDLVVRRRYDKLLWLVLRTTPAPRKVDHRQADDESSGTRQQQQHHQHRSQSPSSSSSLTIPLGHGIDNGVPSTSAEPPCAVQMIRGATARVQLWFQALGGASVLQLFYYTHLIWSCRALETHFGSSISYLSAIGTVVTLSSAVRFGLIQYVVMNWGEHRRPDCAVLRTADLSSSPMRLCMPLLVSFQLVFPHTAIAVVPFFHQQHHHQNALFAHHSHSIMMPWIILGIYVWWEGSIRECLEGWIVTYAWVRMGTPLLVGPIVWLALLALVSHRWLCDSVGWDRRTGRLKVYDDETRQWTPYEPYLNTEEEVRTDSNAAVSDNNDDADVVVDYNDNDDNSMADDDEDSSTTASNNDIELRPRRRHHREERDDLDEETVPLVDNHPHHGPPSAVYRTNRNEVRSRRGGGGGPSHHHPNSDGD